MNYYIGNIGFNNPDALKKSEFTTLEDRNNYLISQWNTTIDYDDTVYLLGNVFDFRLLKGLKGNINIVFGGSSDKKFMLNVVSQISTNRNENYDKELFKQYIKSTLNIHNVYFDSITIPVEDTQVTLTTDILGETMHKDSFYLVGNMGNLQRVFSCGINTDLSVNGNRFLIDEDILSIKNYLSHNEDALLF